MESFFAHLFKFFFPGIKWSTIDSMFFKGYINPFSEASFIILSFSSLVNFLFFMSIKVQIFFFTLVRIFRGLKHCLYVLERFQFHFGTIDSIMATWEGYMIPNFNSTLVRLIDCGSCCWNECLKKFQFQFGTIDRKRQGRGYTIWQISIPLWYDW